MVDDINDGRPVKEPLTPEELRLLRHFFTEMRASRLRCGKTALLEDRALRLLDEHAFQAKLLFFLPVLRKVVAFFHRPQSGKTK